jgi:hypothetical protein
MLDFTSAEVWSVLGTGLTKDVGENQSLRDSSKKRMLTCGLVKWLKW